MILAEKLMLGSGSGRQSGPYLEFVSSTPMTITPKYTNSGVTLQYSLDAESWTDISSGATTPSANVIYFRGQATGIKSLFASTATSNAWTFTGATNLEVYGKPDRLIQNALGDDEDILSIDDYCYVYMFYNVSSLIYVDTDCLPASTLATRCYQYMFYGCTNLTTAPELPATVLAARCYQYMFRGCASLTTAPELPATTLDASCYNQMFYGCTSLTTPPSLPATTLAPNCYSDMFYGCTSLTVAPELPATVLADYCCSSMFNGCTSLTTAPSLPATTLATSCYQGMFQGCTSLTTAPSLPATTLVDYCYYRMFQSCTSIKISTTLTGIYDTAYRIPTTGTGTTATSALTNMFTSTGGTFKGTPTIDTTYYTENTPV